MIQATSTLIVCDFHCSLCSIFILQKYISLTLIIVCVCFFVNYRSSILLSSCFLVPHPIHASLLLSSKNVYGWKKCGFLCNKSSKTCKTSHYLHDVIYCVTSHILYHWLPLSSYLLVSYSLCIFQSKKKKCIKFKITLIMANINKASVFTQIAYACALYSIQIFIISQNDYYQTWLSDIYCVRKMHFS